VSCLNPRSRRPQALYIAVMPSAVARPRQRLQRAARRSSFCGRRRGQSVLLRASRDTPRPSTRPTRASATSAVRRENPERATEPAPERPRSSSMTRMRSSGQPSSRAFAASAYWRSVDSRLCRLLLPRFHDRRQNRTILLYAMSGGLKLREKVS